MKLAELLKRGDAFYTALRREGYLSDSGRKARPEFQRIYEEYADLSSDEALAAAQRSASTELLQWVIDLRVGRRVAHLDEAQRAWERDAVLRVDGCDVPYLRAAIDLGNSPDRSFRLALGAARVAAGAAALNDLWIERLTLERQELAALGLGDYVATRSVLSGINLDGLGAAARRFLMATGDLYVEALGELVRRRLHLNLEDLEYWDALWLRFSPADERSFDAARLVPTMLRLTREMDIDTFQAGRIHLDIKERLGKQPRPRCAAVQVPGEVYLLLQPRGGHTDYQAFLHEYGHALHYASTEPNLPFAARWLGDDSVTEGFAMLWGGLTGNPAWIERYIGLSTPDARRLASDILIVEFFGMRVCAAKLCHQLALYRGNPETMGPDYARQLTEATRFRYQESNYLLDIDPGFYAARYLRGWQLEALLASTLTARFGSDWYRSPPAGKFLQQLMNRGQAEDADAVARRVTDSALSFDMLTARLEAAIST